MSAEGVHILGHRQGRQRMVVTIKRCNPDCLPRMHLQDRVCHAERALWAACAASTAIAEDSSRAGKSSLLLAPSTESCVSPLLC